MIHVFRKIRHNLLEKNNFRKYLTYTIGEVIIVIIGILIAIQINNLNEDRKDRKDELYYISKIKLNLEADVDLLTSYIESNSRQMIILDSLLIMLQNPQDYDINYFKQKIMIVQVCQRFIPTNTTFSNLIYSNNLSIIGNQEILDNLFSYYRRIESIYNIWDDAFTFYNRNFIVPHFVDYDYYEYPESKYSYDFSHLIKGKSLIEYAKNVRGLNWTRGQLMFVETQFGYYSSIRENVQSIIEILDAELK